MNYPQAVEYFKSFEKNGISPGLERINELLELLWNPQRAKKYIHVAGTNGKGSVCSFLASILGKAGYKTGLFTSPYLNKINECIRVGRAISDKDFAAAISLIKDALSQNPDLECRLTYFEVLTAAAFLYFDARNCDYIILETGLGGEFDSTNVIRAPLISIITKISFDHTDILGQTIEEITLAKAGIIKPRSCVVLSEQLHPEVEPIVKFAAEQLGSVFCSAEGVLEDAGIYHSIKEAKLGLAGEHQRQNAAAAVAAALILRGMGEISLTEKNIFSGLKTAKHPCRLEKVGEKPLIYIDGAHNPDGMKALTDYLASNHKNKKIRFIFGVLADKDYIEMAEMISPLAAAVYTASPQSPRALPADMLAQVFKSTVVLPCENVQTAIKKCVKESRVTDIICIVGSLYLAAEARRVLKRKAKRRAKGDDDGQR